MKEKWIESRDADNYFERQKEQQETCNELINHVLECDYCLSEIQSIMAHRAGSVTSEKKAAAARLNGMKGGRPKKNG